MFYTNVILVVVENVKQILCLIMFHDVSSTRRNTEYAPPPWCGYPTSHLYLSEMRHCQWSCPSPTYDYYFTGPGLGAKWRKILFSGGNW